MESQDSPEPNRTQHRSSSVESLKHPLDRRRSSDERDRAEFSPEWETRAAISAVLEISAGAGSLGEELAEILKIVSRISWMESTSSGAIFIANSRDELVMTTQYSLGEQPKLRCARVAHGHCLCGQAAVTKDVFFENCVRDGEACGDCMDSHGHYSVPLMDEGNIIGTLVIFLGKGHQPHSEESPFMKMLGRAVSSSLLNRTLKARAEVSRLRLRDAQREMLHKLAAASEFRDSDTGAHIQRMSHYAVILGRAVGLSKEELALLELSAPMHDIGKVGIPDRIMLKPSKLDANEYEEMKGHTTIGGALLAGDHPFLEASRQVALTHHERWDGKGYPNGLAGSEIPIFGRICALVDVFDALTSTRPYKPAWPIEEAVKHISDLAGKHFDPILVDALLGVLPEILEAKVFYEGAAAKGDELGPHLSARKVEKEYVAWDDSLSVGVPFVDQQHRFLINIINRVHAGIEVSDIEGITEALMDMKVYADVHFREEEKMMHDAGYPELDSHKKQHEGFIKRTSLFLEELEDCPLAICTETAGFLREWLVQHIQRADSAYASFFAQQAASNQGQ